MKVRDLIEYLQKLDWDHAEVKIGSFNQKYEEYDYDRLEESDIEMVEMYGETFLSICIKDSY